MKNKYSIDKRNCLILQFKEKEHKIMFAAMKTFIRDEINKINLKQFKLKDNEILD